MAQYVFSDNNRIQQLTICSAVGPTSRLKITGRAGRGRSRGTCRRSGCGWRGHDTIRFSQPKIYAVRSKLGVEGEEFVLSKAEFGLDELTAVACHNRVPLSATLVTNRRNQ